MLNNISKVRVVCEIVRLVTVTEDVRLDLPKIQDVFGDVRRCIIETISVTLRWLAVTVGIYIRMAMIVITTIRVVCVRVTVYVHIST